MKIYTVGGAVRDGLLGLPVKDRDHVVVGATPQQLLELGFRPVGKDFPVFLHPDTHEEYALARTERKTAPGYRGFAVHAHPDVTLDEDLARRDLTINSIAIPAYAMPASGQFDAELVADPNGGRADLAQRVLRHVTPAFREDPVRILRLARFAARFSDFTVAPETTALMQAMVADGEVDHLVPERVWQELAKGLMEAQPSRMFEVLRSCGALARLLPELDRLWGIPQSPEHHPYQPSNVNYSNKINDLEIVTQLLDSTSSTVFDESSEIRTLRLDETIGRKIERAVDCAAQWGFNLPVRFAVLLHCVGIDTGQSIQPSIHSNRKSERLLAVDSVCKRLRVPAECSELAVLTSQFQSVVCQAINLDARRIVQLLKLTDAFRRPQRFLELMRACEAIACSTPSVPESLGPQATRLLTCLAAAEKVDAGKIAVSTQEKSFIPDFIDAARVSAVEVVLGQLP